MKYKVLVDDNFHYMDESERYSQGEYEIYEEAVSGAKKIVDEFLNSNYKFGMTAGDLYDHYQSFGDDPSIVPSNNGCRFSAWNYAKQRCQEICKPEIDESR
jgi:hypothetical protein